MSAESQRLTTIAAVALAAAALMLAPSPVAAHAIDSAYQLPLPLWLYLVGAGAAVAASFVVTALADRGPSTTVGPGRPVPEPIASLTRTLLRALGLVWWYGAIVVGFAVGDISPLPAVLVWVGIWVALPIAAALVGNPWPSLSPIRTTYAGLEWLAARVGITHLDAGLPYPRWLGRWPAVALLAAALWTELILPGSEVATTVATLVTGYTVLSLLGCLAFGPIAWLRNAELFEVLLGWYGRIGPIGRRSISRELCNECEDGCDPGTCIDCPECAVAAEDGERRPALRRPFSALAAPIGGHPSDAAFIVLALAGVTYDGLRETAFGATILDALLTPAIATLGPTGATFLLVDTAAFALVVAAFGAAFTLVMVLLRTLSGGATPSATAYAATLLPIAAGYLIAHYGTLVIRGLVWLPALVADPLMSLAPDLSWIPAAAVWYGSVIAIVGGHVAGIVLAHRIAVRHRPERAAVAGSPMVALMIGYTVVSLWIIAQPIVIEPGVPPAAFLP